MKHKKVWITQILTERGVDVSKEDLKFYSSKFPESLLKDLLKSGYELKISQFKRTNK